VAQEFEPVLMGSAGKEFTFQQRPLEVLVLDAAPK